MKTPLFKSLNDQNLFDHVGILKINLLDSKSIEEIIEKVNFIHPEFNSIMAEEYYFSVFGKGNEYMKSIRQVILPIVQPYLNEIFHNYKILTVVLQIKGTSEKSSVGLHQDLTVVDENRFNSMTVWIPLMDSTLENGAIQALKGSQNTFRSYRAHTIDYYQFEEVEDYIKENSTAFKTKIGEALVFDPAVIHYSEQNRTQTPRISIAISIVNEDAPIQIGYHDKKENESVTIFDVPDNFFYLYNDFGTERLLPPSFGTINRIEQNYFERKYNKEDFIRKYENSKDIISDKSLLINKSLQTDLDENGYIKIGLLTEFKISELISFYENLTSNRNDIPKDILYTCLHNNDKTFVHKMNTELQRLIIPEMNKVLKNFKFTSFTFQIKGIGHSSELFVHQDWSFSDESKSRCYTIWIPLHDSTSENGTVYILPKSHQKLHNKRGPGIEPLFSNVQQEIRKYMIPIQVKAGELLLFDSAIAHFSPSNLSNEPRLTVMTNLIHKSAEFMLYFGNETNEVDSYSVPNDFLVNYDDFKKDYNAPPKGSTYYGTEHQENLVISKSNLLFTLNLKNESKNLFSFFKRLIKTK
jgi:ectoine hydroxylase-related dioxygenase (phytanoyl-CoA dioxygenase family)